MDNSRAGIDSASEGFGKLGKAAQAGMAVAAAAIVGAGAAVAAFSDQLFKAMDVEKANDKLAAQLGLTAEQSESYGRAAGELWSSAYGESLGDVNEALRQVSMNIGDAAGNSDDAMKNATASVMDFSAAFGEDLGPTTRAVGVMIKNGLAKDASEALDILTVGMQKGANAGEDLLDTFTEYGTQFRELGIDATMAMGMISQSMQAGARDSDFVADAIKEFAIRSKDGSKTSAEAFQAIGLNAQKMTAIFAKGGPEAQQAMAQVIGKLKEMKDPVAQDAAAVALFGTKAEDLQDALYAMDPTTAVASLGEVEGAAKLMGDTLADNAATKLEAFKRSIQQNVTDFFTNTVIPKIVELGTAAAPAFETFKQKAEGAFAWAAGKPEILGAVAAVVGVVLVAAFIALAAAAWSAAAGVIAATWPILAIAAAVALLAAGIVYAWNNWSTFREVVTTVATTLQSAVGPAFEFIKALAISFYETALKPLIGYIMENGEAFSNLGKVLLVIVGIIVGVVVVAIGIMIMSWVAMITVAALVITAIVAIIAVLYNVVQVLWDVHSNARNALGGVIDWFENLIQVGWDLAQNIGSAIADAIRWVWSLAMKVNDMANTISSKINEVIGWFIGLPGRIAGAVGDLGRTLLGAGRQIIDGLLRGIEEGFNRVKSKLGELTRLLPAWKGPKSTDERILEPTGGYIMEGLMTGISRRLPDLRRQLNGIGGTLPMSVAAGGAAAAAPSAAVAGASQVHNWYVQGSIRSDQDLVRLVRDELVNLGFAGATALAATGAVRR